jgi:acetyltransferase-like isoleucine patch superfamily enzyme
MGSDARSSIGRRVASIALRQPRTRDMSEHFQHPQALVETARIGRGTRVWAFAHILPGATVGADCNICDGVFVENDVVIGDRVTLKCGVQIWDGITLEDDVFIGPNATFTNDGFPRSRRRAKLARTLVRRGASIGANATILPGLTLGVDSMVGAGAVVTRDVPPNAIVVGNPARIVGYVGADRLRETNAAPAVDEGGAPRRLGVRGGRLHRLPLLRDLRGALTFGEIGQHVPFDIKRYFLVFDVPSREVRGEHAHKELHEFLVCLRGSCSVALDDGENRDEVRLESPALGLHVPPKLWRVHYKYSPDAMLLVLASDVYKADDYIRSYDEFVRLSRGSGAAKRRTTRSR